MSLKNIVALNVRNLRTKAGLTQEELSEKAGLNTSYIARLESSPQNLTLDVIEGLAGALKCSIEEIVGGTVKARSIDATHLLDQGLEILHRYKDLITK